MCASQDIFDCFELTIDFVPNQGDPKRPFKSMSELIDAFQIIENHLIGTIDVSLETEIVLEDIEKGSLKSKFRNIIKGIPDEAVKEFDWKKLVGQFLLKAKKRILVWTDERNEINDRDSIKSLEGEIKKIAEESNLKQLPIYRNIPSDLLLSDILLIQNSLKHLEKTDKASYSYGSNSVDFNKNLKISNEIVREVLTKEIIDNTSEKIIKVKKPDYIGQSQWSFVFEGHLIDAKINDEQWLSNFQNRKIDVKPGDSLVVELFEQISYGYEMEVVYRHYEIIKVKKIIKPPTQTTIV